MRKFDTKVQYLKYKVLREVAREAWNDTLLQNIMSIPEAIVPGKTPTMRCCVYKERAILGERIKIAMGGDKDNPNVIEVIDIACDECSAAGYVVTESCRGCLAHRCEDVCKRGAITFDHNHVAHIDKSNHSNDIMSMIKYLDEFDNSIKLVYDRLGNNEDVCMIVTADHESGKLKLANNKEEITNDLYKKTKHTKRDVYYLVHQNYR